MKSKIERVRVSLRLSKSIRIPLKKKADRLGISENAAISMAVSNYIKIN